MDWSVHGPTYESAFGMWYGTWDAYRPDNYPSNGGYATPWQQYQVALNVAFRGIWKSGIYTKPAGLTAWGSYRNGCYSSYERERT